MSIPIPLEVADSIAQFRPRGPTDLIGAVDLIARALEQCRERGIRKLYIDARGLTGIPMPSLVDRFLMVEEWAQTSRGQVAAVLVVHAEYIHPQKFGTMVARDFGMTANVFAEENEALDWLRDLRND